MSLLRRLFGLTKTPLVLDAPPAPIPAAWPTLRIDALRDQVVVAAMDLNRTAGDHDGDLFECQEATRALFRACDRLASAWAARYHPDTPENISRDLERELPAGSA